MHRGSGDGWLRCADGRVRWGVFGAAGVLFVWRSAGELGPLVMVQRRSEWAHEGGTWSVAGGAIDAGESPFEAALREASEEVGPAPEGCRLVGEYVFAPAADWRYTTVVVEVPERFGGSINFETDAVEWVPLDVVDGLPKHPGFAAAWPQLRQMVESME